MTYDGTYLVMSCKAWWHWSKFLGRSGWNKVTVKCNSFSWNRRVREWWVLPGLTSKLLVTVPPPSSKTTTTRRSDIDHGFKKSLHAYTLDFKREIQHLPSFSSSESEISTPPSQMVTLSGNKHTRSQERHRVRWKARQHHYDDGGWETAQWCQANQHCFTPSPSNILRAVRGTYWEWSGTPPFLGRRTGRQSVLRPGYWGRPCTPPPRPGYGPPMEASR